MTLIVGDCPSRDAPQGKHQIRNSAHVTYYDCRGRIMHHDGPHTREPRVFAAVANCEHCLKPLVIHNAAFPVKIRWRGVGGSNPWRELRDESELVDEPVIQEAMF